MNPVSGTPAHPHFINGEQEFLLSRALKESDDVIIAQALSGG